MQSRIIFAALAALLYAGVGFAQDTPTPTQTPFAVTPRPGGSGLMNLTVVDTSTNTTTDQVYTSPFSAMTATVNAIGTCTAYDLFLESVNTRSPAAWAIEQAIDEAEIAGNTGAVYQLISPVMYRRVRITGINTCRLVVSFAGIAP